MPKNQYIVSEQEQERKIMSNNLLGDKSENLSEVTAAIDNLAVKMKGGDLASVKAAIASAQQSFEFLKSERDKFKIKEEREKFLKQFSIPVREVLFEDQVLGQVLEAAEECVTEKQTVFKAEAKAFLLDEVTKQIKTSLEKANQIEKGLAKILTGKDKNDRRLNKGLGKSLITKERAKIVTLLNKTVRVVGVDDFLNFSQGLVALDNNKLGTDFTFSSYIKNVRDNYLENLTTLPIIDEKNEAENSDEESITRKGSRAITNRGNKAEASVVSQVSRNEEPKNSKIDGKEEETPRRKPREAKAKGVALEQSPKSK